MYNSIISRRPTFQGWRKRAFEIQQSYWGQFSTITSEKQKEINDALSKQLDNIRQRYGAKLKQVDETVEHLELDSHGDETSEVKFSSSMQTVSQECTTDMLSFAKEIITQSVNILSDLPPCDFSVLAIGSMA